MPGTTAAVTADDVGTTAEGNAILQQFLAADLIPDYDQPGYFKTAAVTFSCTGSDTDFIAMLDDLAAGYPSVQLQTFTISTRSYANPDGTSEEGSVYTVSLNVILCDKGGVPAVKNIRLGDLLIELGYITPDQLTARPGLPEGAPRPCASARPCRSWAMSTSARCWNPCQAFADSAHRP